MTELTTTEKIQTLVRKGRLDDDLADILQTIYKRQKYLRGVAINLAKMTMEPGTKVVTKGLRQAKWNGRHGTIKQIYQTRALVVFKGQGTALYKEPEAQGGRTVYADLKVKIPLSCLDIDNTPVVDPFDGEGAPVDGE